MTDKTEELEEQPEEGEAGIQQLADLYNSGEVLPCQTIGPCIPHNQFGLKPAWTGNFRFDPFTEQELEQRERKDRVQNKNREPDSEGDRMHDEFLEMLDEELKNI